MKNETEIYSLIESLNKERYSLLNSKEYCYGRKIANLKNALFRGKILKLFNAWHLSYKIKKLSCNRTLKDYSYGDYPNRSIKICVYTCITGGYDKLQNIYVYPENIDYIAFTDDVNIDNNGWNIRKIPDQALSLNNNADINRYMKMHPQLVGDYDYAIYVDGLVEIYSDLSNLINVVNPQYGISIHNHFERDCVYNEIKYCNLMKLGNKDGMKTLYSFLKQEGYPEHYGLLECTAIVTDIRNNYALEILESWWEEHIKWSTGRDQLTLPYILWKNNILIDDISTLGNSVKNNPKFRINGHRNYKYNLL